MRWCLGDVRQCFCHVRYVVYVSVSRSCLGVVPVLFSWRFVFYFAVLVVCRFCGEGSQIFLVVSRLCCGCISVSILLRV